MKSFIRMGFLALSFAFVGCGGAPDETHAESSWWNQNSQSRLPENYESLRGCEKQELLWKQIESSRYSELPRWKAFDLVRFTFMNMSLTMDRVHDEMPEGRKRLIHTYGSVAKLKFEAAEGHPYTGIWQSGSSCALLRTSLATDPSSAGVIPGLGLKFFVDGLPSENLIAMHSLDGQGSNFNFFANEFSNIVAEPSNPALKLLKAVFERASRHPTKLALEHISLRDEKGNKASQPNGPVQIFLVPTSAAQLPAEGSSDFRVSLATLPSGTPLYQVFGVTSEGSSERVFLGTMRLDSRFVSSQYGDDQLFFRHRRFNNE